MIQLFTNDDIYYVIISWRGENIKMKTTKQKQGEAIVRDRLKQSFALAKEGQYEKARYILQSIDHHPKAQELLKRLEGLEEKPKSKSSVSVFSIVVVIFVVVTVGGAIIGSLVFQDILGRFTLGDLFTGGGYALSEKELLEYNLLSYCQIETYYSDSCEGWASHTVSNYQVDAAECFAPHDDFGFLTSEQHRAVRTCLQNKGVPNP